MCNHFGECKGYPLSSYAYEFAEKYYRDKRQNKIEVVEIMNGSTGEVSATTITYKNPEFKKKHLTQADIDRPDPAPQLMPYWKKIGVWIVCGIFCFAAWYIVFQAVKLIWEVVYASHR